MTLTIENILLVGSVLLLISIIAGIVFFVSVTSVLIQGTTLSAVAHWLHVALPEKVKPKSSTDAFLAELPNAAIKEITVTESCYVAGKKIVDLHFPAAALIAMIQRAGKYITPNGSTVIEANDVLIVLSDSQEGLPKVYDCLQIQEPGKPT